MKTHRNTTIRSKQQFTQDGSVFAQLDGPEFVPRTPNPLQVLGQVVLVIHWQVLDAAGGLRMRVLYAGV